MSETRAVKKAILGFIVIFCSHFAIGNVGENQADIEKRYGRALSDEVVNEHQIFRSYSSSGFKIVVTFLDGVSEAEAFHKQNDSDISENEIRALLEANSRGRKWISATHPEITDEMWKLADDSMLAGYNKPNKRLIIFTHAWSEFAETKRKSEKSKN
jgi:hypothetical protein